MPLKVWCVLYSTWVAENLCEVMHTYFSYLMWDTQKIRTMWDWQFNTIFTWDYQLEGLITKHCHRRTGVSISIYEKFCVKSCIRISPIVCEIHKLICTIWGWQFNTTVTWDYQHCHWWTDDSKQMHKIWKTLCEIFKYIFSHFL